MDKDQAAQAIKGFADAQDNARVNNVLSMAQGFMNSYIGVTPEKFTVLNNARVERIRCVEVRAMTSSTDWSSDESVNTFALNSSGLSPAGTTQKAVPMLVLGFFLAPNYTISAADLALIWAKGFLEIDGPSDDFKTIKIPLSECVRQAIGQTSQITDSTGGGVNAQDLAREDPESLYWEIPGGLGVLPEDLAEIKITGLNAVNFAADITLQLNLKAIVGQK